MHVLCTLVVVVLNILCSNCERNIKVSEEVYKILPPIFHIDDYEKCKLEGKLFCKISIIITPTDAKNTSYYWKVIEESIKNNRAYNHNELFHAICVNDFCPEEKFTQNGDALENMLSSCYTRKYEHLGLTAHNITFWNCSNHDDVYNVGTFDFVWLFLLVLYSLYTVFCLFWDYKTRYGSLGNLYVANETANKFITPFSPLNNWNKLLVYNNIQDFQKLKCIQGIRFYNMLLIIFCHTYSSYIGGYVKNTDYIENIANNSVKLGIRNLLVYLVQTFFLFSSFLMSYHVFQIMECNKTYNNKYIFLMFFNRYLRIIPPVLIMMGLGSTTWVMSLFYGPIKDLYSDLEYQRCRRNWWTILFFINNHYNQNDMCFFTTWYLAADTQLYLLSLIMLSVIWKFRHRTKQILTLCIFTGILIPTVISYIYNLDIIYRITPENAKNNKFRSFNFNAIYSSTYANMATYMVGISLGYVYSKNNELDILKTLHSRLVWFVLFLGLPTLVVITSSHYYTRFFSALLCGILKPLYALGIGIGILGMSQRMGGSIKSICEWKPAVFMGNFTYSTYVVHYGIVFYRTAAAKQPLYISDYILVSSFICDAILSFLCGFLMHIFVEMPALQLQKMLIPQVKRELTSTNGKCKD